MSANSAAWFWKRVDALLRVINRVSEYDHVELARQAVVEADTRLADTRKRFKEAKEIFEDVSEKQRKHQQDINALLHRKPNWSSQELAQFTEMCQVEHEVHKSAISAKRNLTALEEQVEHQQSKYMSSIREHYHEEQVWAEKGRRISTYGTLGLILFNSAVFLLSVTVIEPGKREAIAQRVISMNKEITTQELRDIESRLGGKLDAILQLHAGGRQIANMNNNAVTSPAPAQAAAKPAAALNSPGTAPDADTVQHQKHATTTSTVSYPGPASTAAAALAAKGEVVRATVAEATAPILTKACSYMPPIEDWPIVVTSAGITAVFFLMSR